MVEMFSGTAEIELADSTEDQNGWLATLKIILKFEFVTLPCCVTLVWWKLQGLVSIWLLLGTSNANKYFWKEWADTETLKD